MQTWTCVIVGVVLLCIEVRGHGYLVAPLGRDSAWRVHRNYFRINYNDNQVFCGGFTTQHENNGGRCGICGDDYTHPIPRNHERGGYYSVNNIVAQYRRGSVIDVSVNITTNHYGVFYFDVCVNNDPSAAETEDCFQRLIPVGAAPGTDFYTLPSPDPGVYTLSLQLPDHVTCSYCVLRWKYLAGNNWGCSENNCCLGCGTIQETFYACSDVMITESGDDAVPSWKFPDTKATLFTRSPSDSDTTATTTTTTTPSTKTTKRTTTATTTTTTTLSTSTATSKNTVRNDIVQCPTMCHGLCSNPDFTLLCGSYCCSCSQYRQFVHLGCTN